MTDQEKGYVAGIIDGEGTVTLTKDKEFRYPTISVSSTTYEILEFLQKVCGGVISKKNERNLNWKQAYCWKIERRKAIALLDEVVELLREPKKKARAELILKDYIKLTPRNGRYSEIQKIEKHAFEDAFFAIE